jgi:hypothetical protein
MITEGRQTDNLTNSAGLSHVILVDVPSLRLEEPWLIELMNWPSGDATGLTAGPGCSG